MASNTIHAEILTKSAYVKYGSIISAQEQDLQNIQLVSANSGTAKRYNFLSNIENLRQGTAKLNLCVFRSSAQITTGQKEFQINLLEKHPYSAQVFIPMNGTKKYLVVVCLGDKAPDLSTCRAFIASGSQGITYRPGVWHHPLIAMENDSDFACLVYEDETVNDGEITKIEKITVTL